VSALTTEDSTASPDSCRESITYRRIPNYRWVDGVVSIIQGAQTRGVQNLWRWQPEIVFAFGR
jgi:hypothetical protein